ncbi:hypothetical protein PF002_g31770, partial [Phytophthora fragariae]
AKLASRFFRAGIEQPLIRVREATRQFAAYHEAGDDTAMAPTTRPVSSSGWRGRRLERTRIARRRVQLKHTLSKTAEKLKPQQKPFAARTLGMLALGPQQPMLYSGCVGAHTREFH